jgi:hypothetical protein
MTSPLSGRHVLVVEDEMMVAWLLEDMLADLASRSADAIFADRRNVNPVVLKLCRTCTIAI